MRYRNRGVKFSEERLNVLWSVNRYPVNITVAGDESANRIAQIVESKFSAERCEVVGIFLYDKEFNLNRFTDATENLM
jgi:hypothetical protein